MSDIDRRTVLAGAGAMAAAAMLPVMPAHSARALFDQCSEMLRTHGTAGVGLGDGGVLLFWLEDRESWESLHLMTVSGSPTAAKVMAAWEARICGHE